MDFCPRRSSVNARLISIFLIRISEFKKREEKKRALFGSQKQ